MSGTRGGVGRIVAMGIGLAVALLLLAAAEARAGRYAVAQCGWHVGADAAWADTTGGAKFRSGAYCVPPVGDPFDGVHLKSFTRDGQGTVSGTRFARWRWTPPPGTGIAQVRGTWWHALHDGIEQRLGTINWGGGFEPFATAAATDAVPRNFVASFPIPAAAFEDRLLCARAESKWCSLDAGSWSGLRALTITIEDGIGPSSGMGGELTWPGWRRGTQQLVIWGSDVGAGVRYGETLIDGARVALSEYPCAKAVIDDEWRATQMQPCLSGVSGNHAIATAAFADGPHTVQHCVYDFSGNGGCTAHHPISIDNNPPAHPRSVSLTGGEGWRRTNDFDLAWANPDQGPASPIGGASWRLVGPAGFDTGVQFAGGRNRTALSDLALPAAGVYPLQIWLRDEAGNEAPGSAVTVPLRLDDLAPGVAFAIDSGSGAPEQLRADVVDPHAGPAAGALYYRRADAPGWTELVTKLVRDDGDAARLVASMPELAPGTYLFRAEASDLAGNTTSTTRRADGTEMAVRRVAPALALRGKTRLFARLRGSRGRGEELTVPFAAGATVSGRLARADGAGIAGREIQLVSRPVRGSVAPAALQTAVTGSHGGFSIALPPGPSRRIVASFAGDGGLEGASRSPLDLRVRSGLELRARPRELRTGQDLRLSGRVYGRGAPMPRRGKLVAIQYLETATRRWRPVIVTRSDRHGRFRARYRFRYVEGVASIRLRATALAEERWPYAPGSSRPLTVRVRGLATPPARDDR